MGRSRIAAAAAALGLVAGLAPAVSTAAGSVAIPVVAPVGGATEVPPAEPIPVTSEQAPVLPAATKAGPDDVGLRPRGAPRATTRRVVEIRHDGDQAAVVETVAALGGRVHGPAGGHALEATVGVDDIEALATAAHVTAVTTPSVASPEAATATTGQEVAITNANDWHAAGLRGSGVKVGIIDTFDQSTWNAARASGDVPAAAGTFCRWGGSSCSIWSGGEHGVAVAEIVYEMAPATQLYIATAATAADMQAAINWFHTKGVKVVTRSETAEYDGRGDGTGPLADVVASAVSKGMVYLNSAGNSAGKTGSGARTGSYWRGSWYDPDGDGVLNWSGSDERLTTRCWFFNGLRWSDWGSNRTDYDVYVYRSGTDTLLGGSESDQGSGALPLERLNGSVGCTAGEDVDVVVRRYHPGGGTAGDVLELMVNGVGVEHWSNPFSAASPMADSASPGMLTVGAIDPAAGDTIAAYSSHGPTTDGRTKPDLAAAACVSSVSYAPSCFNGTSAAAPVAAGAVALAVGAQVASTPAGIADYIRGRTVDRGAAGVDNVYGRGELVLPAPPSAAPYSSWSAFVTRQFGDLVGRAPTAAERERWIAQLAFGPATGPGMVASLRTSNENTTNVDPMARLYWAYFLRIPDKAGLDYWIGRRRGGTSVSSISQGFAASPEFLGRYGPLTHRAFVELVYVNVLGREGDAAGVDYWTGQLISGAKTRGAVMVGFSESPENKAAMRGSVDVAVITSALLRRAPAAAEVTAHQGETTVQIAQWALSQGTYVRP